MRKAAGVLMVIGAFLGMVMLRAIYGFIPGPLGWLPLICIPISIIPILAWSDALADASGEAINFPFAIFITIVFLAIAILPVIGVKLRKTEWES